MIKEIRYKNFKALRDATLPLGRFTLIVGANGTGKSTAIQALEMAKKHRNISWKELYSIDKEKDSVWLEIETYGSRRRICWEINAESGEDIDRSNKSEDVFDTAFNEAEINIFNDFRIFSFEANKIAESVSVSPNLELEESGRNLAGILDQLRDSEPEKFEELNNELNHWFPEFDRILFEVPNQGTKSFLLRTAIGKHKIKAKDLSDGTRLALAYLTIAYLPNPPKIVAFEEPEKGIHPRLLENIQEAMYRLAYPENYGEKREPVQVIATTHSPYLLDLYKDYPEEIVISSKDENGVHFEKLTDQPHFEEVIQDAPLGEVWFTGVLGGVPAQP